MLLVELDFRHGCEFSRISAKLPGARIVHWCSLHTDYVEVATTDASRLKTLRREFSRLRSGGLRSTREPGDQQRFTLILTCGHRKVRTSGRVIEHKGGFIAAALEYTGGLEIYRSVLPEEKRLQYLVSNSSETAKSDSLGSTG